MLKPIILSSLLCIFGVVFSAGKSEKLPIPQGAHRVLPRDAGDLDKRITGLLQATNCLKGEKVSFQTLNEIWHQLEKGKVKTNTNIPQYDQGSLALLTMLTGCKHVMDARHKEIAQLKERIAQLEQRHHDQLVHAQVVIPGDGYAGAGPGPDMSRALPLLLEHVPDQRHANAGAGAGPVMAIASDNNLSDALVHYFSNNFMFVCKNLIAPLARYCEKVLPSDD